jgi:branched-chain amino acid transport system permease protein
LILNRIIRTSLLLSLVVTFGIDLVLTDATVIAFTSDVRSVNASYASTSVAVFGTLVPLVRLIAAGLSLAIGIAFFVFLRRASLGQAILATALDREISNLMGINPQKVFALTAGAGAALAGAAGSLSSMLFPVSPTMGVSFLAGFLYGLVQAWAAYWLGTNFQEIVAFAMFLGVLVVRPQGLFGRAFFGEHA